MLTFLLVMDIFFTLSSLNTFMLFKHNSLIYVLERIPPPLGRNIHFAVEKSSSMDDALSPAVLSSF